MRFTHIDHKIIFLDSEFHGEGRICAVFVTIDDTEYRLVFSLDERPTDDSWVAVGIPVTLYVGSSLEGEEVTNLEDIKRRQFNITIDRAMAEEIYKGSEYMFVLAVLLFATFLQHGKIEFDYTLDVVKEYKNNDGPKDWELTEEPIPSQFTQIASTISYLIKRSELRPQS